MEKQVHLLNGDSLLNQINGYIDGEKIVCRECLVEGNVKGDTPEDIFENRACYLLQTYNIPISDYHKKSKQEFKELRSISAGAEINLWFEDDLFCQCNFWFVCYLLVTWEIKNVVYLVRPAKNHVYSFGTMPREALPIAFRDRVKISHDNLLLLHNLWLAYQNSNTSAMIELAQKLHAAFPFIGPAVYAHISYRLGIPEKSLKQIISDLETHEFGPVFKEFCQREAIYGLGDLQVKRMFDKITEE